MLATLNPHPTIAGVCLWTVNLQLTPGPKFRDSDYIDMVSFRGAGASNYGANTRMFFKGKQTYTVTMGPAPCNEPVSVCLHRTAHCRLGRHFLRAVECMLVLLQDRTTAFRALHTCTAVGWHPHT